MRLAAALRQGLTSTYHVLQRLAFGGAALPLLDSHSHAAIKAANTYAEPGYSIEEKEGKRIRSCACACERVRVCVLVCVRVYVYPGVEWR